ncbi:hypothetical protein [Flavobacterium sp. GCM10027622]|uniref:hypothetical protein n=1 Tax=unclassified Flavobacterium TaxID=196869 RepID=UPI003622C5CD
MKKVKKEDNYTSAYFMNYKTTLLLLFLTLQVVAQTEKDNIAMVVGKSNIGKTYTFGECDGKTKNETQLTYLGNVKTKKGIVYKVITSVWTWGMSCRSTHRILIFNTKNQYVGNYYILDYCSLPTQLQNGFLIVHQTNDTECGKKTQQINLNNGLPKSIFGMEFQE